MKITLFGATGMVGKQVINLAVLREHDVRAFGRNVLEKLPSGRHHLELVKGYLFHDDDVEAALAGADAVISALGGATDGVDKTRSIGMKKIVAAMEKLGLKRIVAVGGLGVLNATEDTLLFRTAKFPLAYIPVSEEHYEAWQHLAGSSLDWTFVCPPMLVDAPISGQYATRKDYPVAGSGKVNTGDLADFMLRELTERKYLRCRVGISGV